MSIPGIGSLDGTGLKFEILANDDYVLKSITIDTSTRDSGNTTTTDLRRGLLLCPDSDAGNRYIVANHADGSQDLSEAVVLAENIYGIDDGNHTAAAFWRCTLKNGRLIDPNSSIGQAALAIPASRLLIDVNV